METNVAKFFSKFFQLQLYKRRSYYFFYLFYNFSNYHRLGPSENIVYTRESWSPREDKFRETTGNDKREKFTRVWVIEDLARVAKIFFIPRLYDLYAAIQHRRHLLLGMLALTGVADENISLVEIQGIGHERENLLLESVPFFERYSLCDCVSAFHRFQELFAI